MEIQKEHLTPPVPPRTTEIHRMEAEMLAMQLRGENSELQLQVGRQETELNKVRAQIGSIREERDRLKRKVFNMFNLSNRFSTVYFFAALQLLILNSLRCRKFDTFHK